MSLTRMTFGKHAGKPIQQIPHEYLRWVLSDAQGVENHLREAIANHLSGGSPRVKAVVTSRPTSGGDRLAFIQMVNSLRDKIRNACREKMIEYRFDSEDSYLALTAIEELHEAVDKIIDEHLGSA